MPTLTPDTPHTGWMRWIYQIPTPQTKILVAVVTTLGTFIWAWVSDEPDPVTLGILLGFCTSLFGIASVDLNTKRKTDLDYQDAQVRKIEANAGKVTVQNVEQVTVTEDAKPERPVA